MKLDSKPERPTSPTEAGKPGATAQPPRPGRLVLAGREEEVSRLFMIPLAMLVSRLDQARRKVFMGDLDMATIADTVGLAAIEPLWRDASFREQFSSYLTVIGVEPQRGINALSISQATNIPRETVRRKAKKMVKHDYLAEKGRARYITKPGYLQKPETVAVQRDVIRETMRFINMCLEVGAIKWVEPVCATNAIPATVGVATAGAATAGAAAAGGVPAAMAASSSK